MNVWFRFVIPELGRPGNLAEPMNTRAVRDPVL